MKKKHRIFSVIFVLLLVVGSVVLIRNPYKSYYKKETPVTNKEAVEALVNMTGYPAGEGIIVAKSIEDIMSNEYCTIEVSKENIESTRTYLIKDKSESGNFNSKVGRKYYFSQVHESYCGNFDLWGDFLYLTRQIYWNLKDTSYGEWCVVELDSGERVYVLVDLALLDIRENKKIKLPIGKVVENYNMGRPSNEYEQFDVDQSNSNWYIDMVGYWEEDEVGDISVTTWLLLFFLLDLPLAIYLAYKYIEKKGY